LSLFDQTDIRNFPILQQSRDSVFSFVNGESVQGIDELIRQTIRNPRNELKVNFESFVSVPGRFPLLKYCRFGISSNLHRAVTEHDLAQLIELLSGHYIQMNSFIDDKNEYGKTALHLACSNKDTPVAIPRALIENNASLFLRDAAGKIPLFYAIESDFIEIVKLMIEKSRDVIQMKDSLTLEVPLHVAAKLGKLEIVKILIENNASQCSRNRNGKFPIEVAADNKHGNVVKFLEFRRPNSIKHALSHGRLSREASIALLFKKREEMTRLNENDETIAGIFLLRYSETINKNVITMLVGSLVKNYEISKTVSKDGCLEAS
jgi:hypothetical protein